MAVPLRRDGDPRPRPGAAVDVPGARRARCIAVAGESNSGKSSVINLILRRAVLPVSAAAGEVGLVSLYPGPRRCYRALGPGGTLQEETAPELLSAHPVQARIEVDVDQGGGAPLVIHEVALAQDCPPTEAQRAALAAADLLVWCTMAQRAWSRTEIALVDTLPTPFPGGSILVVTRADLLPNDAARARVRDRLRREAEERFAAIVMLDCRRPGREDADDPADWRRRGGEALADALRAGLAAAATRRAAVAPGPPRLAEVAAAMARAAPPLPAAEPASGPAGWTGRLDAFLQEAARDPAPDPGRFATDLTLGLAKFLEMLPVRDPALLRLRNAYATELARIYELQYAGGPDETLPLLTGLALQLEEDLSAPARPAAPT